MVPDKNLLEFVPCVICQKNNFEVIATFRNSDLTRINRSLAKLKKLPIAGGINNFRILKCRDCGLVAINPRPTEKELSKFYNGFYSKKFQGKNVAFELSPYNKLNTEQEKGRLAEIQKYKKRGKILDIGAGPGHFLKVAKDSGWKTLGFDISKEAAAIAQKEFAVRVISGKLKDLQLKDNYFDVISLHSTVEHTTNPKIYIDFAYKKLKPQGLLVFSAPNLSSLNYTLAKFLNVPYPGFIFEHLYYFNPKSIKRLLGDNFNILKMTSYHHSRLPCLPENTTSTKKSQSQLIIFLKNLSKSKKKLNYIRKRLYYFQMRILREFLEYNQLGGSLKLGDIIYVFAKKQSS